MELLITHTYVDTPYTPDSGECNLMQHPEPLPGDLGLFGAAWQPRNVGVSGQNGRTSNVQRRTSNVEVRAGRAQGFNAPACVRLRRDESARQGGAENPQRTRGEMTNGQPVLCGRPPAEEPEVAEAADERLKFAEGCRFLVPGIRAKSGSVRLFCRTAIGAEHDHYQFL